MIDKIKKFLFHNKSAKQTILKNTFWLITAEGVSRVFLTVLTIITARYLKADGYGLLNFAFAFVGMFTVVADFGFATLAVRDIARDKSLTSKYIQNISLIKSTLGIITLALIIITIQFVGKSVESKNLVYLLAFWVILQSFADFSQSIFRAFEKMQYETLNKLVSSITLLCISGSVIYFDMGINNIARSYIYSALITFIFAFIVIRLKFAKFKFEIDLKLCKELFRKSWPFAGSGFLSLINFNFGMIVLGYYNLNKDLGNYSAAYKIVNMFILPISFFFIPLVPKLSTLYNDKPKLKSILAKIYKIAIPLSLAIAVIITVLSKQIILVLFSDSYKSAHIYLSVLIWSFFMILAREPAGYTLTSINLQKKYFFVILVSSIANVMLNLVLIPKLGAIAVPITNLICESINCVLMNYVLYRFLNE